MQNRPLLRVLSWNVNGLRACHKKGFLDWLAAADADLVGVQEVRARPEQLDDALRSPEGWSTHFSPAERPGYSGVGLFGRRTPEVVHTELGEARFDAEGRLQIAELGRLVVANVYFPNGNGKNRDNSRVPYKLEFYQSLFERLQAFRDAGRPVLVMGDFNTAHREIDLANPKSNRETSGFLPEERAELDRWLEAGWVDTFRHYQSDPDHYTWWSQRKGVRARNVGWRIDYVLASPEAMPWVRRAYHQPTVMGSDHCPIGVDLDPAILA